MTYLLDTHVWLWMLTAPERLGSVRSIVETRSTELLLSAASVWEIAIKVGRGRLTLPRPVEDYVSSRVAATGVVELPVTAAHAIRVAALPDHHRDPFDRLLVAQSLVERAPVVTADPQLSAYDCEVLLVE